MISIIIPMYNAENYIEKCLRSVLDQTFTDIEVIVINDGSTDGSEAIVRSIAEGDLRVHLFSQDNHGLVNARKQGIKRSRGEYVLFVDADDWISENAVEELYKLALDNNADVVASGAMKAYLFEGSNEVIPEEIPEESLDENGRFWGSYKETNIAEPGLYRGEKLEELKSKLFCMEETFCMALLPYLWNKLWKRELIERFVLAADERITVGEDVAIGFPAILASGSLVVTNACYYYYRQNNASMMKTIGDEQAEYENAKRLDSYLRDKCDELGYLDQVGAGLDRFLFNQVCTRAYSVLNRGKECQGLYPFMDQMPENLVIYGAGELGKAVYRYASGKTNVKAWIDGRADIYQRLGMPVISINEYIPDAQDTIVVAVFRKKSVDAIVKDLADKGAREENIHSIIGLL